MRFRHKKIFSFLLFVNQAITGRVGLCPLRLLQQEIPEILVPVAHANGLLLAAHKDLQLLGNGNLGAQNVIHRFLELCRVRRFQKNSFLRYASIRRFNFGLTAGYSIDIGHFFYGDILQ
jgi:hypothetical protein